MAKLEDLPRECGNCASDKLEQHCPLKQCTWRRCRECGSVGNKKIWLFDRRKGR